MSNAKEADTGQATELVDKRLMTLPALEVHDEHPLQYWRVHGSFRPTDKRAKRLPNARGGDFLLSILRCRLPDNHGYAGHAYGYMLLSSYLPEKREEPVGWGRPTEVEEDLEPLFQASCHVTENLFDYVKQMYHQPVPAGLNGQPKPSSGEERQIREQELLHKAIAQEMERFGPFAPTQIHPDIQISEQPFRLDWHGSSIYEDDDGLEVQFRLPGDGRYCTLNLQPTSQGFCQKNLKLDKSDLSMDYMLFPRNAVTGLADGIAIRGEAWFEQQSCSQDWVDVGEPKRALVPVLQGMAFGRNHFALNLDDGSDLLVLDILDLEDDGGARADQPKEAEFLRSADQLILYFAPGKPPQRLNYVKLDRLDIWESPCTLARYPVKCRLTLPEIDAELTLDCPIPDQELPVLGVQLAIYHGSATILGRIGSDYVAGTGRLAIQGYAKTPALDDVLARLINRTDSAIERFLPRRFDAESLGHFIGSQRWQSDADAATDMISKPAWDMLDRGGKHWRPTFALLLMQAFGVDFAPYEDLLTILPELVHNGALMVDDVEDQSTLRRGEPSTYKKFGTDTAINAGNSLYFLPMMLVVDHPALSAEKRERFFSILTKTFVQAHFGQAQDLFWTHRPCEEVRQAILSPRNNQTILQGYAQKTASEVTAIAHMVAVILDLPEEQDVILSSFSEGFGVAFQIADDVNNFEADPQWGKDSGEDLASGKPTYVLCRAIQAMDEEEQAVMLELMCNQEARADHAKLQKGIELVKNSGMLARCRKEARDMLDAEWRRLDPLLPPSLAKVCLKLMCDRLIKGTVGKNA